MAEDFSAFGEPAPDFSSFGTPMGEKEKKPSITQDLLREFGGTFANTLGGAVETGSRLIERIKGGSYPSDWKNILQTSGERELGQVTPQTQEAMRATLPTGNVFEPSTWRMESPSVRGALGLAAQAAGNLAPQVVGPMALTRGMGPLAQGAAGAGAASLFTYGPSATQEEQRILQMPQEELDKVPLYQELIASRQWNPVTARAEVARRAGVGGGFGNTIPSMLEGAAENILLPRILRGSIQLPGGALGKIAGGTAGGALIGGTEETVEQMSQNLGANIATGEKRPLGEGTMEQFALGALGEGGMGTVAGLAQSLSRPRAKSEPIAPEERPVFDALAKTRLGAPLSPEQLQALTTEGLVRQKDDGTIDLLPRGRRRLREFEDRLAATIGAPNEPSPTAEAGVPVESPVGEETQQANANEADANAARQEGVLSDASQIREDTGQVGEGSTSGLPGLQPGAEPSSGNLQLAAQTGAEARDREIGDRLTRIEEEITPPLTGDRALEQQLPKMETAPMASRRAAETPAEEPTKYATGRIVGAPPGRATETHRSALVRSLSNRAEHPLAVPEKSLNWYEDSAREIVRLSHGDRALAEKALRLMALYSQGNSIGGNTSATIQSLLQEAEGKPMKAGRYPQTTSKVSKALLAAPEVSTAVPGVSDKIVSFYKNLRDAAFGENNHADAATIDRWMMRLMGYRFADDETGGGKRNLSPTQYAYAKDIMRRVAETMSKDRGKPILPRQAQAALWTYVKNAALEREYKAQRKAWRTERASLRGRTDEYAKNRITKLNKLLERPFEPTSTSFADYLNRSTASVTWETVPGQNSGRLPGIHKATYEQKEEYTRAARSLIVDERGRDQLLEKLQLQPLYSSEMGIGSFGGAMSPNAITGVIPKGQVSKGFDTKVADVYASALGYLYHQDASAWHMPDPNVSLKDGFEGVQVVYEEPTDAAFAQRLLDHVRQSVPADFTRVGEHEFRFINFERIPDFNEKVQDAIESFKTDNASESTVFRARSGYIEGGKDGQEYAQRIREAGRSDLLRWLDGRRKALDALDAHFAQKYGWGKTGEQHPAEAPRASRRRVGPVNEAFVDLDDADAIDTLIQEDGDALDGLADLGLDTGPREIDQAPVASVAKAGSSRLDVLEDYKPSQAKRVVEGWKRLAQREDVFQRPRTQKKTLSLILQDMGLIPAYVRGTTAIDYDTIRIEAKDRKHWADLAFDEQLHEAFLDIGNWEEGLGGAGIYQAVLTWAANNGYKLVPDPSGLSRLNYLRRTEVMLSAALRVGTTRYMQPSPRQGIKGWNNDVTTQAEDDENLARLILKSYENTSTNVDQIEKIKYDPAKDQFTDEKGNALPESYFRDLSATPAARKAASGSATLKRAAITRALLLANGRPARAGVLQAAGGERSGAAHGEGASAKGALYSRGATPGAGQAPQVVRGALVSRYGASGISNLEAEGILKIVPSFASLPEGARMGMGGGEEAIYWQGTAYLIADNLTTDRAPRVLMHEVGEHYGLKDWAGDEFYKHILQRTRELATASAKVGAIWDSVRRDYPNEAVDSDRFVQEVVARLGEQSAGNAGVWQALRARAKQFLATLGLRKVSVDDINDFMSASLRSAMRRRTRAPLAFGEAMAGEKSPVFYSALQDAVGKLPQVIATPDQWKGLIRNLKGVKPDEIEWSGVNEWLDLQNRVPPEIALPTDEIDPISGKTVYRLGKNPAYGKVKVIKSEIMNYLQKNGVQVEETMLTDNAGDASDPVAREMLADMWLSNHKISLEQDPEVDDLTYEALLAKAERRAQFWVSDPTDRAFNALAEALDITPEEMRFDIRERTTSKNTVRYGDFGPLEMQLPGGFDYRELLLKLPARQPLHADFTSPHFEGDGENLLGHVRFNTRTDAEGRKVLFLEELQSDWAEQARRRGFAGEEVGAAPSNEELIRAGQWVAPGTRQEGAGVPRAPFVNKTESWVGLLMKRMIRYAAENGYDSIAWTTGEQQNDRYSLSHNVHRIDWSRIGAERSVMLRMKNDSRTLELDVSRDGMVLKSSNRWADNLVNQPLADVVGKSIAEKIMAKDSGHLAGPEELVIGGEGMRSFYDKIVPNVVNDLLKKFGGGRVGNVVMSRTQFDDVGGDVPTVAEQKQPGFDITPALRDRAMLGLPLFSRPPAEEAPRASVAAWAQQMPPTTQEALRKAGVLYHPPSLKDRIKAWAPDWQRRVIQGMFDQFSPLKELDYHAYMLARLSKGSEAPLEALLKYGTIYMDPDGAIDVNFGGGGFIGMMQQLAGEHDRFFGWVVGNRAERLMSEGREHNLDPADIKALKALNQGQMDDGSSRATVYERVNRELQRYNKSVLDLAERAGLIDGQSRPVWERDFYVPFYRMMDDEDQTKGPVNPSGLVRQYAFKKLKGGARELGDPMENTIRNWSHLINASMKNNAARESIKTMIQLGAAQSVPSDTKGAVYYVENGKNVWVQIDDPFLLDAVKSIGFNGFTGWPMKVMQKFKHALTMGVTISPSFRIRNLIRDSLQMIGTNKADYNILSNIAVGWKNTHEDSPEFAKILAGAGVMRYGTSLEGDRAAHEKRLIEAGLANRNTILDTHEKVLAVGQKMWDWWQHVGDRSENINRAALYKYLRDQGATHLEASFAARDTMDFSLQGTWAAVRMLAQVVPFMNARLQGFYKIGRGAVEDPRRFGIVSGAVALASIALFLSYKDDDDFKAREDWDRETYWWFKIGDTAYRIPKPFEIGALGSIAERAVEAVIADDFGGREFADRLFQIIWSQLSMNPTPQLFKPMIEVWANRNSFTDRPIELQGMQNLSKEERSGPNTSAAAKVLTHVSPFSPVQIDHLVQGYFGWMGTMTMAVSSKALTASGVINQPPKPAWRLDETPVAGDFARTLPSYQSKYVSRLYDQMDSVTQAMADLRYYQQIGATEKMKEIIEAKGDLIKLYPLFNAAKGLETKVNQQIKLVMRMDLDPETKRARLDNLYAMRNRIAKVVDERVRALKNTQ